MQVVFLVGGYDGVLDYFFDYVMRRKGCNIRFIAQSQLGISVNFDKDVVYFEGEKIHPDQVSGIYMRIVGPEPKSKYQDSYNINTQLLIEHVSQNYTNVINPIYAGISNNSKPYQLSILNLKELKLPETYIFANIKRNNLDKILTNHSARYIFKSVSSCRSIVTKLDRMDRERNITCPVVIQEFLGYLNIRVHVIDNKVFALAIESETSDYRYASNLKFNFIGLPKNLIQECIDINQQLRLRFSGIDLMRRKNDFYLLEVNPSPGYSVYEGYSDGRHEMSAAIYEALIGSD